MTSLFYFLQSPNVTYHVDLNDPNDPPDVELLFCILLGHLIEKRSINSNVNKGVLISPENKNVKINKCKRIVACSTYNEVNHISTYHTCRLIISKLKLYQFLFTVLS